jgi:hypothetical protein
MFAIARLWEPVVAVHSAKASDVRPLRGSGSASSGNLGVARPLVVGTRSRGSCSNWSWEKCGPQLATCHVRGSTAGRTPDRTRRRPATGPATGPPRQPQKRIVKEREYLSLELDYEDVAEFDYRPGRCKRSYKVVALRKNISRTRGDQVLTVEFAAWPTLSMHLNRHHPSYGPLRI